MRHRKSRLRLRQKPVHSRALLRNLLTSVFLYESVRTNKKRAEVVRPMIEKLITVAKTKAPHIAIREINRHVVHKNASRKLMEVLKPRYQSRTSGYTRLVPLGARKGDGAELVTLELVDRDEAVAADPTEKAATKVKTPKAKKTTAKKADAPAAADSSSAS
jgi:large subunit ribosomal protein L17